MPTPETSARYLLDTHTFLWLATDSPRLGQRARSCASDPGSELFLSVASVWEMAIKKSLGKLHTSIGLRQLVDDQLEVLGIRLLEIGLEHAIGVEDLIFHHRDPFDRLLVAQAIHDRLTLLSRDEAFDAYPVARIWD